MLALVLTVDALAGDRGLAVRLQARRDHAALQRDLVHLRAENARLRQQARRLREDPVAIEEVARREHLFIRPGEKVFIIRDLNERR
jgi:cell division protein FtsB